MDKSKLIRALSAKLPPQLASDLAEEFISLRQDVATNTFGRAAPGKFVETLVQALQFLESGKFGPKPDVDEYLRKLESQNTALDDGLKICASRIGRAMYTLRNKRNIAHKGSVDPNRYDLLFLHAAAQWILAELVRLISDLSMDEAGRIIEQIQLPIGTMVEDFGDRRLVLAPGLSTRQEILILLHSHYPEVMCATKVISALDRRSEGNVRKVLQTLWKEKKIEGNGKSGYKLTQQGYREAADIIAHSVQSN